MPVSIHMLLVVGERIPSSYTGLRVILVYWGLRPQQQPGSYQGGEMMVMKSGGGNRSTRRKSPTTDLGLEVG